MRSRDLAGCSTMALVVGVDCLEGRGRRLERREAKHSLAVREVGTRPSVLDDHGLPAREVAYGSVADPRILEFHEDRLRATPLTARLLDVGLVTLRRTRHFPCIVDAPPVAFEQRAVRDIAVREEQG